MSLHAGPRFKPWACRETQMAYRTASLFENKISPRFKPWAKGDMQSEEQQGPNSVILYDLVKTKMPFGKYKGTLICDLPVSYLEHFNRQGFPKGRIGMLLQTMYEIALNGLRDLLTPLRS